jgi:uncharacterized protein
MIEVDVRDLVGHPGSSRRFHVGEAVEDLRLELAAVPEDRPIEGELLLESVVEGILVSGPLTGRMELSCARCLKSFEQVFQVEVSELFVSGPAPGGEEYELDPEGAIDLEPMVRDAVLLAMPFSPLCRLDCKGICERCGGDRNTGECTCAPVSADDRWAPLAHIRFEEMT